MLPLAAYVLTQFVLPNVPWPLKLIVLDAKESFTMQKLFETAWAELYPGMIEWVGLSNGGALSSVDAATKTFSTDFDKYKAAVGNVIPPQKAGRVAELAQVTDRTGWCPVDPVTFISKLQPNIHVIGDAAQRILHRHSVQLLGLKKREKFGPGRAIRPGAVNQNDVFDSLHKSLLETKAS